MSVTNENSEIVSLNELFHLNELKQAIKSTENKKWLGYDEILYEVMKQLDRNALGSVVFLQ